MYKPSILTKLLELLFARDNFFSRTIIVVVKRLKTQKYLFVIAIGLIFLLALVVHYIIKPDLPVPFYLTLIVIFILALISILDFFKASQNEGESRGQGRRKLVMSKEIQNSEIIKKQLEKAKMALGFIEQKAAGIPVSERSVSLVSDLEQQRQLVDELEKKLDSLTKKG